MKYIINHNAIMKFATETKVKVAKMFLNLEWLNMIIFQKIKTDASYLAVLFSLHYFPVAFSIFPRYRSFKIAPSSSSYFIPDIVVVCYMNSSTPSNVVFPKAINYL